MANNVKYVIDDGKNKFAAYDAESVDSKLDEKVSNAAFNSAVEELEGEIEQKANTDYVNEEIARIETIIEDLPEPMIFKGTLGTGGTIQELPTASASNEGFTYKVITEGTYAGQSARVGDVFISNGSEWVLVPAGDDFNDTWRAIKVNGTEVLNNAISSGAVNFNEGDQLTITFDAETKTLNFNVVNTYTKQEVYDIIYNVLPDGTASGAIANFNTSLQLPIKSMKIDVNAKQDLHGYGYPWTAGSGVNKFNKNEYENLRSNYDYVKNSYYCREINLKPNTTYTVSLHSNTTSTVIILLNNVQQVNERGFLDFRKTDDTKTFTTDETGNLYIGIVSTNTDLECNERLAQCNIQIEEGATATTWTPYENICQISGINDINFIHCGTNLWNEIIEIGALNSDGTLNEQTTRITTDFISVKPNQTYRQSSLNTAYGGRICFYDINKNCVRYDGNGVRESTKTFTTQDEEYYVRITLGYQYGTTYNHDISINYPSSDTEYHTYNGDAELINLGGIYYGGKLTQDKDGHRQFEVTSKFATFTGANNESWIDYPSGNGFFIAQINDHITESYGDGKCNILPTAKTFSSLGIVFGINSKYIFLMQVKNSWNISTVNELRSFLSVNNLQVVYTLAEPIIIDLPDGEPINTFNGINNFFFFFCDTTVTFKQSVNDAINAAVNAANNNRTLGMINMSKGNESEEKEETKEDLNEESNEK